MVDEEEHEDVVIGILDDIIDSVLDVVYDRYIQSRLVPYTVQTARDLIIQTIEVNKWYYSINIIINDRPLL